MATVGKGARAKVLLRLDPGLLERVDAWAHGEGLPDRTAALCELISRGLGDDAATLAAHRSTVREAFARAGELGDDSRAPGRKRKAKAKPSTSEPVKAVASAVADIKPADKPKRVVGFTFDGQPIYR